MQESKYYNLSNPQKSIWNMEKYFEGTAINNICTPAIIYEKLDKEKLEKAINNLVKKNDNFRIQIEIKNGIPVQYISEYKPFILDYIYLKNESDLKVIENEEVSRSFAVINFPLFRFKIAVFKDDFFAIILTTHHLIADSWSLGLVIKNILQEYHALLNNQEFTEKSASYLDYIHSEQEYKKSERYKRDKSYWLEKFKTTPEQASIPSIKVPSKTISANAKRKTYSLDKELTEKIKDFCAKNKISIFNFFMAIYSIYISRVSNLDDFVIGTPILNRVNPKEKQTMGMFVNTIPLRIKVKPQTFNEFANTIGADIISTLRHQKYSYTQILEDLKSTNLYNILISYQITKAFDKKYGNYKTDWVFNNYCSSDLNIHITDINDTGCLDISYDYLIYKYELSDVQKMHNRIINIANQVLNNNTENINELEIVTEKEKNELLHSFNSCDAVFPKKKNIVDLFEEQVQKTPNNVAVSFENKQLTYRELNEKANSLANYLIKNGIKHQSIIGLRIDKSLEMIIGILAIIKAGCCYLPINTQYPEDRVKFMLKDSNAKILLGNQNTLNEFELDIQKIDINLSRKDIYEKNSKPIHINISPEDLIYIIYTSGSTGTPKGAMLCHRNVVRLLKNDKFLFDFSDTDVWTLFHSIAFDFSVWEMYGALLYGGKLVIVPDNVAKDPYLFLELLEKEKVTVLNQTPTYFYNLLNTEVESPHKDLKIRYIIFGGEALKPNLLMPWYKLHPSTKLINMYGITETTVHVTFKDLTEEDLMLSKSNIGIPIPTLKILLLDSNLKLVPPGVPGEICVCGDGVFKGYLNREDLNKTKLVQNPYNRNEIIYRSADSGIYSDGSIEYLGRIDTQVKIRGFRVELGEIEEKITNFKNIKSCFVTTKKAQDNHDLLCAYYIKTASVDISKLRNALQKDLPSYMIPQYFIEVKEWPYNHNGKIDKKSLPEPEYQNLSKQIVLPRNAIDIKLIKLLQSLLNANNISIDDNFFEIGGDSLSAINLCTEIQSKFEVQLFVKDILENPIIQDLSDIINKNLNTSKTQTIKRVEKSDSYVISSAQKRIYYTCKIAGNSCLYNVPGGIIFDGNIDKVKLEKCLNALINRHEALRTYFKSENNSIVQKVLENVDFKLDILENADFKDLSNLFKNFVKPFNLEIAPLFRAKLISFTNKKYALFVDMHHIISDGTSMSILVDELCKLYNDKTLSDLTITYKDFAAFEHNNFEKSAEDYWMKQFQDEIPVLNMPTQYPRPSIQNFEGDKVYSLIEADTVQKIQSITKSLNITPYMFLLACYYILLSKYSSSEDIIIGSPVIGRSLSETYNLIGMFVNTLALRNTVDSNLSFKDFVLNIKEKILDAYKYQTYPFDELVKKLNIPKDTSRNPLFDVMFIYQNNGYKKLDFKNIQSEYYTPNIGISKFDLSLEAIPTESQIKLSFEYATKLFEKDFIKNLSNHYLNILNFVLDNLDTKISDINILSEKEKNKILYEFNNTKTDYPKDKTIVQLFEQQVQKTPDNIALVFEDKHLTYKELNKKANSLAYYLRNNIQISRNDLVGIMVNRSLEMIISILAVLKAGGAYIPIDPSYPNERVSYMLDNSQAKVLLTQKKLENKITFAHKLFVDLSNENIYINPSTNLDNINKPEDLSYVIFTSGSTGLPKGVMLNHKAVSNLTNYCNNYIDYLKNPIYRSVVSITTVSFDIFIFETLISLQKGLRLVIANENEQVTPSLLNNLIEKRQIEVIQSTPSRMQILIDNLKDIPTLKNIKYFTLAGEQLPLKLVNTLKEISGGIIYNGYGPSETTVFSTLTKMDENIITIGKPLDNTQIYILDKNLKPVPIGVDGEIYISGDGVGKGYLNNKELTLNSFIKNPFIPDSIMYKTGDIGQFDNNGRILCKGRSDHQIKIRGLRIELGEIENLVLNYPNIQKVVVIKQVVNNREFLCAYFVSKNKIVVNELRNYLSQFLPMYMVPSYFISLDSFPYTPNGKIDKKALTTLNSTLTENISLYEEPKTKIQKDIAAIWKKILHIEHIGIYDNFFELGGDSLLAMNLNIELLKISDKITYQDIFNCPTIAQLEEIILLNKDASVLDKIENLSDEFVDILDNSTKKEKILTYHPKNVLLTGSTGFLGIHILQQLIENENCNIYCIIRKGKDNLPENKLIKKLNYYFGNKYDYLLNKRIFVISGNITEEHFGLNHDELLNIASSIDIVINSAASVAHYGKYKDFYNTNVKSVKYIIDFCRTFKKKLYHISTKSVTGFELDSSYPSDKRKIKKKIKFTESSLYFGQTINNLYAYSKFQAEKYVLNAMSNGLDAYILRMGLLMPRFKDGIFQENILDNDFINKIISFKKIGIVPDYLLNYKIDFTPVDYAAKAIYLLISHPNKVNRIFHLYNHKTVSVKRLINVFQKSNYEIKVLTENDFKHKIDLILNDNQSKHLLKNLINDFDKNKKLIYKTNFNMESKFTVRYLRKIHFRWPRINNKYLLNLINILRKVI